MLETTFGFSRIRYVLGSLTDTEKWALNLRKKEILNHREADEGWIRAKLAYLIPSLSIFGGLVPVIGPFFGFRLVVLFYFLVTLFGLTARRSKQSRLAAQIITVSFIWLVVVLVLLLFRGVVPFSESEILSVLFGLVLLIAIMLGPKSNAVLHRWIRGWLIAFLITVVVALRELLFGAHLSNYYVYNLDLVSWAYTGATAATLGNPNNFAFFLVATTFILGAGWGLSTKKFERTLYGIAILVIPILILPTESRLSLMLIALVWSVYLIVWKRSLIVVFIFVALGFLIVVLTDFGRLLTALGLDGGIGTQLLTEASLVVRMNLFRNGLKFASDSNFIGIGPGAFEYHMSLGGPYETGGILSPHSAFIELFTQYGLLCTILVLFSLLSLLGVAIQARSGSTRRSFQRSASLSVILGIVSMPVLTVTTSATFDLSFFWVYIGLLFLIGVTLEERQPIKSSAIGLSLKASLSPFGESKPR